MSPGRFNPLERRHLLSTPRIGPRVVAQLESLGLSSLDALRHQGVASIVERLCRATGGSAWRNRQRALQQALEGFGRR